MVIISVIGLIVAIIFLLCVAAKGIEDILPK